MQLNLLNNIQLPSPLTMTRAFKSKAVNNLIQADPQQLGSKTYRDSLVSSNLFLKAVQLYNDLVAARSTPEIKTADDIRKTLESSEFTSLNDLLKSRTNVHISDLSARLRGTNIDQAR